MRLICPNCDAEYEVDEAAIPEEGRDVLCSACGHSWFQLPPGMLAEKEEEEALFEAPSFDQSLVAPPEKESASESGYEAEPEGEAAPPEGTPAARPISGRSLNESLMAVLREEAARETAARREESSGLETQTEMPLAGSTSAASILSSQDEAAPETLEEAAVEQAAESTPEIAAETPAEALAESAPELPVEAAAEPPAEGAAQSAVEKTAETAEASASEAEETAAAGTVEPAAEPESGAETGEKPPTQPEPGPATAAMRKIAKLRGKKEPPPKAAAPGPESGAEGEEGPARRELLPEIDEINSTLRDTSESREVDEGAVAHTIEEGPKGGGFRDGFLAVMVLVILGGALYLAAPIIAAKVPALLSPMMAYVHAVDGLRIGLDALVQGLSNWVSALTGGEG